MKIFFTIIEWFVFLVCIVILLAVASPLLPTKNVLSTYVVTSGSMEPTLKTGGLVFTKGTTIDSLKVGDVITFKAPIDSNKIVVHRIYSINESPSRTFKTKGDNNKEVDNWILFSENIVGKLVFSLPYLGYGVIWLKTPIGFVIGMGVPAIFLLILQVRKIKQGINEEVEKRTKHILSQKVEGIILFMILGVFSLAQLAHPVYALFSAKATLSGITLHVSSIHPTGTPIPTLSPTITPSVTVSPTPSVIVTPIPTVTITPSPTISLTPTVKPTLTPTPSSNITVSGNGAGSVNTIEVNQTNNTTIIQNSSTTSINTIDVTSNTGENSIENQNGSSSLTTGSSSLIVALTTSSAQNYATLK